MKIPKIIHYCWFGTDTLPELEQRCIASWARVLPDYRIIKWDENNIDVSCCDYVRQAYECKKFAFVSDYFRMKALYEYGGIYLDTDVEVLKSFAPFLNTEAFLGFENRTQVGTAMMAAMPHSYFAKQMLDYYHTVPYIDSNGVMNMTTNVTLLNDILVKMGMKAVNLRQSITGIEIYPRDFFFPKKISETDFKITSNTICIHRMSATWLTERQKRRGSNPLWINLCRPTLRTFQRCLSLLLGSSRTKTLELWIRNKLK